MRRTVLLVGANNGLGIGLARALVERKCNVIGTVHPQTNVRKWNDWNVEVDQTVKEIEAIASRVFEVDLKDESSIYDAAKNFGAGPLDMLINITGIEPEPDNWYEHTSEILIEKFTTNSVGAFLTSKHFYPNLKKAGGTIINISSNAGSITLCKGEDMAYRMSKAALNMMTVTMAKEFQMNGDNISVLALSPGYSASQPSGDLPSDEAGECIEGMVKVIESVGMEQTGTFLDWRGLTLPW